MEKQVPSGQSLPDEARTFAADLANAIHMYVSAADVTSVGERVACPTCGSTATVPAVPSPVRERPRSPEPIRKPPPTADQPDWIAPFWLKMIGMLVFLLVASCTSLCCLPRRR